ncbi:MULTISPECIES: mammalian cell entry protein [unclassified Mycolicibacterium]|uniref:mammalian cell entry protein n=1 Tax=unclassified Mycolicibacterium TaxID=2636767 RepID=UPI002EDAB826
MEDQPTESGDLTTETSGPEGSANPRRRRRMPWQRKAQTSPSETAAANASTSTPAPEARPKPRTPVGKGRRGAVVDDETAEVAEPEIEAEETAAESEVAVPAAETEETAAAETAADESETDSESAEESTDSDESAPSENENVETVMVPFRPAGKRLTYVAAGAAALFVAAGAFAGAMVQPYLADQALVATKLKVAETSANAITTLWTYTPDNIDSLPQRASQYLSGDFAAQYRAFVDSIVPTNKQAQVSSNTQVMGTAVESIGPDEATAIVYTNSVSTSPVTKNIPSLRYLSYRVTLKRDGSNWRITQMPALTKLDLSPQL